MSKKYKIAIDVSPLNDGNSKRGVGYYTKNLVAALQVEVNKNPNYSNYQIQLVTDYRLPITNFDLIHYPYFDPFFLTLPPRRQTPRIITIHDLIPRQFKSHFPVGIKGTFKWHIQKYLARQSDFIITVSTYSKYVINDILKFPLDEIFVTHEAANSNFRPIHNSKLLSKVKQKYNLPDKFILYVGDVNWNKNLPTLVDVCLKLKIHMVISGSAATANVPLDEWTRDIHYIQSKKSPLIHLLGFTPDEDLPSLFNLATIYCQPSYAEGFGLTLVEAMQSGTPVVYSQKSCLPEIMGEAGLQFDPYQPKSLLLAIKKIWNDSSLQKEQTRIGIDQAKKYSWQKTAQKTLAVYDLALNK